jgi:hypothetical protein
MNQPATLSAIENPKEYILRRLSELRGEPVTFADHADVKEAAKILKQGEGSVRNLMCGKKPRLKKKKFGRQTVIPLGELERFMRFDPVRIKYEKATTLNPVQ